MWCRLEFSWGVLGHFDGVFLGIWYDSLVQKLILSTSSCQDGRKSQAVAVVFDMYYDSHMMSSGFMKKDILERERMTVQQFNF